MDGEHLLTLRFPCVRESDGAGHVDDQDGRGG